MKRLSLIVLLVCLMTSGAYATNSWNAATGYWNVNQSPGGLAPGTALPDATIWSSMVVPADTEQVKITGGKTCDLDGNAGTFNTNKVTVGTSGTMAYLNVKSGGLLTSVVEIQVGDASGKTGTVTQTGGTITLSGTSSKDSKLEVGYKGGPGYYTISGGSIVSNVYSQLLVGPSGGSGGIGTFTVDGTGGSISVSKLYVGVGPATGGTWYTGTGIVAFQIGAGGVSPITVNNAYLDMAGELSTAKLVLSLLAAPPAGPIKLIDGTVTGTFDTFTDSLGSHAATEGALVTLQYGAGTYLYNLTYTGSVVLIPEPATLVLLGIGGLIAARRRKK